MLVRLFFNLHCSLLDHGQWDNLSKPRTFIILLFTYLFDNYYFIKPIIINQGGPVDLKRARPTNNLNLLNRINNPREMLLNLFIIYGVRSVLNSSIHFEFKLHNEWIHTQ